MTLVFSSVERALSVSSMRSRNLPPSLRAKSQLKLNAYTLTGLQTIGGGESNPNLKINLIPPVSTMLQTSLTQTAKAQPGTQNGNVEFPQELSVFFGEAISPRLGTFIQITYD